MASSELTQESLTRLQTFHGHHSGTDLLRIMIKEEFKNRIALLSSFGADAAVLISMVAEIDPDTPILFLETGKHFPETLEYIETLKTLLKLTNIRLLTPDEKLIKNIDSNGELWKHQPNRCCWMRKVEPLERELKKRTFSALITGRKSYQTSDRKELPSIELHEDGLFRINPLISWSKSELDAEMQKRNLPQHPLVTQGYPSIGCAPCTRPVKEGEDERAGRWAHTTELPGGEQKTECGIHIPKNQPPDWTV